MIRKLVLLFAVLALVAAACGDDDGGDATTAAPGATTAAPGATTAAPGDEVALRWMTRPDNPEEAAVYGEISDQLTASSTGSR